jgi:hypothetical protein
MATTTGSISFLKVNANPGTAANANYALFEIQDASTNPPTPEIFFIWYGQTDALPPTGPTWMQRSLQVSMVREAIIAGKTITVTHDSTSSMVYSLGLNA